MIDVSAGKTLRGYELHDLIGAGGFGAVYRAYQPLVKRDVAIKIILPQYANQPDFIRSFEVEAQLVARLEHIHIVPLYDYWREPNGAYLVMRWLRGGSLRQLLKQGPLALDEISTMLQQIAAALTVAHRKSVVHRDIKPDNILLDEERNVYLTDFGIAQDLETGTVRTSDSFAGSLTYTSPEQIKGERTTPLTDIYSLGILLYEAITGTHPYPNASPPQLVFKHLSEALPAVTENLPDLSPEIDVVIQRATAKNPDERFPDPLSMAAAFRRAVKLTRRGVVALRLDPSAPPIGIDTTPTAYLNNMLPDVETPYKGLRPFEKVDAADFFGREGLVERLISRLAEIGKHPAARVLPIVGPSGSGKSSVVKAGLIPALADGALQGSRSWYFVEIVPGSQPFNELESALLSVAATPPDISLLDLLLSSDTGLNEAVKRVLPPNDNSQLLLFIDQFEEIFTLFDNESQRLHLFRNFWEAVSHPDSRLIVIFTLRADFYDRPLMYPRFGELMRQRTEVVLPLKPEELERAIVEPAVRVGVNLEPGLIAAIVADVSEQPGALPLLQYALTELFERRFGRLLTLEAYQDIGGVLGALARRAEELYNELNESGRQATRQLFLRLVTPGDGGGNTRRRVQRYELTSISGSEAAMDSVINDFGKYRLLTFDRDPVTRSPTVEVAHEALIREWTRLNEWLEENREDIRQHQRLTAAANEWLNAGRDPSFVARGSRLEQLETWSKTTIVSLNDDETAYLQASIIERSNRLAAEAAQREREAMLERRSRSRLRVLVGVLCVATLLALGLMGYAFNQSQLAQVQAVLAEEKATEARSLALAASAQLSLQDGSSDLAALLALEANSIVSPTQARLALAEVAYSPGTQRLFTGHDDAVSTIDISPDNRFAVSAARDGEIIVWDTETAEIVHRLEGHFDRVTSVAFSPNGETILTGSWDTTARLWDVASGSEIRRFEGNVDGILTVAFSPGGRTLLTGSNDGILMLWDVASGELRRRFIGHSGAITSVQFSPDSQLALSGSMDRTIRLWNLATGRELQRFEGHDERVTTVAFHPNGNVIASGSTDHTIRLWSVPLNRETERLVGHNDGITQVTFSPDGRTLLSASWDATMILWDLEINQIRHRFIGHDGAVSSLAISEDGSTAVSGSQDGTGRLWTINGGSEERRLRFYVDEVTQIVVSPDGTQVLTGGNNTSFVIWNRETGTQSARFFGHTDHILSLAINADGSQVMSSAVNGELFLWDTASANIIRRFEGHSAAVSSIAFHPTGALALTGSWDQSLILWDTESGQMIRQFVGGHNERVLAAAILPDGQRALSASNNGDIVLWDLNNAAQLRRYSGTTSAVSDLVVTPDGTGFMAAAIDGAVYLWDVDQSEPVRRFVGHRSAVLSLDISTDGTTAVSGSRDRSLILWDIASGEQIYRFEGHEDAVAAVAFTPDGLRILSGSRDKTVREWRSLAFNQLVEWTRANRYIPLIDCTRQDQQRIDALCGDSVQTGFNMTMRQ